MEDVYFQSSQRIRVLEEKEHVYHVEDMQTKETFYIDKPDMRVQYEPMFNGEMYIHLKARIDALNSEMLHLRRANSKQKNENRELRRTLAKIRKEQASNKPPHYKNGKRGTFKNG